MDKYQEMRVFAAVIEAGSFVGAADALDMSKAAVSRHVSDLESRLAVRLLHRTTRKLSLTPEGEVFHERCRDVLAAIDDAETEVSARADVANGLVRMSVPVSFGLMHLAPLWPRFMCAHPKVILDVTLSDRFVDLVDEGFDLAVRIGRLENSSLVSRRIAATRLILCASPGYLRAHGTPTHPDELTDHTIIAYNLMLAWDTWDFTGPRGPVSVRITPRMRTNSGETCRLAALADGGIILQPSFLVAPDLAEGRLIGLLPEYRSIDAGVHVVYPSRKHVSPKVRLLTDFLAAEFRDSRWSV